MPGIELVDGSGAATGVRAAHASLSLLIADNHPIVREGMLAIFGRQPAMRVIAVASNGREAVEAFLEHMPDAALINLRMPVMDGMEAVRRIRLQVPAARLIVISSWQCEEDVYRALSAGAQGYLVKSAPVEELVECIQTVAGGGAWVPPLAGAKLAKRLVTRQLTPREEEVLGLVALGRSNKEIGGLLHISESTVKVHVTHFLEKLKVTSRTEAIRAAITRGHVQIDPSAAA